MLFLVLYTGSAAVNGVCYSFSAVLKEGLGGRRGGGGAEMGHDLAGLRAFTKRKTAHKTLVGSTHAAPSMGSQLKLNLGQFPKSGSFRRMVGESLCLFKGVDNILWGWETPLNCH